MMNLKTLHVARDGYYGFGKLDPTKPFICSVEVEGPLGNVKLNLPAEVSQRVVSLIAEEIAAAGRATAEMMTASVLDGTALLGGK